jgi:hypothetical protein
VTPHEPAFDQTDVPSKVFTKFIEDLKPTGVSPELINRLRKVLLEDKTLTEKAIREAVLTRDESI